MAPELNAGPAAQLANWKGAPTAGNSFPQLVEHPNVVADSLLEDILRQAERKKDISAFVSGIHRKALRYASAFLDTAEACEDAFVQTCIKLVSQKTDERHFMRALKHICLDMKKRARIEAQLFESAEASSFRDRKTNDDPPVAVNDLDNILSPRSEDQDPLDILTEREDQAECERQLAEARRLAESDRRFWWIRQKNWGKKLAIGRDPLAVVNEMSPSIAF